MFATVRIGAVDLAARPSGRSRGITALPRAARWTQHGVRHAALPPGPRLRAEGTVRSGARYAVVPGSSVGQESFSSRSAPPGACCGTGPRRGGRAGRQRRHGSWRETAHGALAERALSLSFMTGGPQLEPYLPHAAVPSLAGASHEPITHGPHQRRHVPSVTAHENPNQSSIITWRFGENAPTSKTSPPHDCRTPDRFRSMDAQGMAGSDRRRLKPGNIWTESRFGRLYPPARARWSRRSFDQVPWAREALCVSQVIRKSAGGAIRGSRDSAFI